MFEIQKRSAKTGRLKYPFDRMEIDEAFIVPAGMGSDGALRSSAHVWAKKLNRRFHVTKRNDGSFEVWRSK